MFFFRTSGDAAFLWKAARRGLAGVALLLGVVACRGEATAPHPMRGLRVVRGGNQTDTALARANPLVVEVRDSTLRLVQSALVIFTAQPAVGAATDDWKRSVYVCGSTASLCADVTFVDHQVSMSDTVETDEQGQATTQVQFGVLAGVGSVRVQVSSVGIDTLVSYTTNPGALVEIAATGLDTTMYVGASFSIGAHTADRWGNTRSEAVTVADLTPSVVALANGTVTAAAEGVGQISLRGGGLSETMPVTVVPKGLLVAYDWIPDSPTYTKLVLLGTDGYHRRIIATNYGNEVYPSWIAGDRIVFQGESNTSASLVLKVVDTVGKVSTLLGSAFGYAIEPAFAAGAQKVYFYGTAASTLVLGLYSANVDGSSPTYLFDGVQPAPSSDGSNIAFVQGTALLVHHLSGGQNTFLAPSAALPRWSPVGDLIAFTASPYTDASISVVHADGTGLHTVDPGQHTGSLSWSPDGRWIVAEHYPVGLVLIRVSDGLILKIHDTSSLVQPSWQ